MCVLNVQEFMFIFIYQACSYIWTGLLEHTAHVSVKYFKTQRENSKVFLRSFIFPSLHLRFPPILIFLLLPDQYQVLRIFHPAYKNCIVLYYFMKTIIIYMVFTLRYRYILNLDRYMTSLN